MIRDARRTAGLSQGAVARAIGTSVSYIAQIENGWKVPTNDDTIDALAHALTIEPDELRVTLGRIPTDLQESLSSVRAFNAARAAIERERAIGNSGGHHRLIVGMTIYIRGVSTPTGRAFTRNFYAESTDTVDEVWRRRDEWIVATLGAMTGEPVTLDDVAIRFAGDTGGLTADRATVHGVTYQIYTSVITEAIPDQERS